MDELDIFLKELNDYAGLMAASRINTHAQAVVSASANNSGAYQRGRTEDALRLLEVAALASIAENLERIVKNGLTVDTTR